MVWLSFLRTMNSLNFTDKGYAYAIPRQADPILTRCLTVTQPTAERRRKCVGMLKQMAPCLLNPANLNLIILPPVEEDTQARTYTRADTHTHSHQKLSALFIKCIQHLSP